MTRPGDLSARLSRQVVRKFGLTTDEVTIHPIGGSQTERYQAMVGNVVQAILVTPPLDIRAKSDGFNIIYRLIDLEIPFIYSSLITNYRMLRERPEIVQRMVAALAETVYFVEKNPEKAKAAIAKAMRVKDEEALQSSYNVYAKEIVDRTMVVPGKSVSEAGYRPRNRNPSQKKTRRTLRQQLRQQPGKKRLPQRTLGNENYRR